jgi:hypothetical protein
MLLPVLTYHCMLLMAFCLDVFIGIHAVSLPILAHSPSHPSVSYAQGMAFGVDVSIGIHAIFIAYSGSSAVALLVSICFLCSLFC